LGPLLFHRCILIQDDFFVCQPPRPARPRARYSAFAHKEQKFIRSTTDASHLRANNLTEKQYRDNVTLSCNNLLYEGMAVLAQEVCPRDLPPGTPPTVGPRLSGGGLFDCVRGLLRASVASWRHEKMAGA